MKGIRQLEGGGVMFWCPACECGHGGSGWHEIAPGTVQPSVICTTPRGLCHVVVSNWQLVYQNDCTNGWANRTIPVDPDW